MKKKSEIILISFPGILWPLEGIPRFLRYFGYLLPFTLPSKTLIGILFSDLDFCNPTIYWGFMVMIGWVVVQIAICMWFSGLSSAVKKKK